VSVDLLAGGASLLSAALMTLMVNARHIFYAVTMLTRYRDTGKLKPYLIFSLTDETFSLVCAPELPAGIDRRYYYFFVSALNQSYWVTGSIIGGILGNAFTFNTAGVDFSMTALFVIIFIEQWESTRDHRAALTGLIASVACLLLFGPSRFLIPAILLITAILLLLRGKLEKEVEA
jgi:4-azaleucine resistance transporter AzlC